MREQKLSCVCVCLCVCQTAIEREQERIDVLRDPGEICVCTTGRSINTPHGSKDRVNLFTQPDRYTDGQIDRELSQKT